LETAVTFDRRWRERDFGRYQGLTYENLFGNHPEFDVGTSGAAAVEATPEEGESLLAMRDRVLEAGETIREGTDPGDTVAIVTHGGPIHALRAHLLDRDLVTEIGEYGTENCSVQRIRIREGEVVGVEEDSTRRTGQDGEGIAR
jgi:probable phosphoglycerate mutase